MSGPCPICGDTLNDDGKCPTALAEPQRGLFRRDTPQAKAGPRTNSGASGSMASGTTAPKS